MSGVVVFVVERRAAQCAVPTQIPGRSQTDPRAHTVRPYGVIRTGTVGSAKPGAVVESQQRQFMHPQAPVGREETQVATQILRAGNSAPIKQVRVPRNGGLGESRHGERSSPLRRPPASFGSFSTWKRNSPPGRRNSPCSEKKPAPQEIPQARCAVPSVSQEAKRSFAQNSFAYFSFQEK